VIRETLTVDWQQVRIRRAVSGLVAMLLAVLFARSVGDIVLSGAMATLFVVAAGGDGPMSARLPGMVRFTLYGSLLGGLAFLSSGTVVAVAAVLGVATYVGTLAAAAGPRQARGGLFLTLWALMALMLGAGGAEPWRVSVAFLVGGAIAIAVTAIRLSTSAEDEAGDDDQPTQHDTIEGARLIRPQQLVAAVSSPIGGFALARTIATIAGVLLGYWWFPSYPIWVAITVIVVLRPSAHQSVSAGVQRTIGTALGVGVAAAVAQVLPRSDGAVVVAFFVSGLLMVAFMSANATLKAAFLTAMLVFGQRLADADAFEAGSVRLLATAVGVLIAFGIIALTSARGGHAAKQEAVQG
jgi:uncharacterized membrane protein YccC